MKTKRACVLGAGNSAHVAAGLIASLPDWECNMLALWEDEAERLKEGIQRGGIELHYSAGDDNKVVKGVPANVSKNPEDVIPGCDVLILCVPALAYDINIRAAAPYVDEGAMIGTVCGSNGFDWCIDEAMGQVGRTKDSYGVFALQNLPWACRINRFGEDVTVLGAKPFMELVVRPGPETDAKEMEALMSKLIRVDTPLASGGFLGVGLSNLCQVIHPAVMYDHFNDWDGETTDTEPPLFYQGLSKDAADTMASVSDEIMIIRKNIESRVPGAELSIVTPIFEWCMRAYGKYITDPSTLQSRFSSNKAFTGLMCPMKPAKDKDGLIPDFQARYLSEDIPYNLVAVKGLAEICGVATPTIDLLLEWSQTMLGKEYMVDGKISGKDIAKSFAPQRFGYNKFEDLPEVQEWLKT